jgi:hypothetical protein
LFIDSETEAHYYKRLLGETCVFHKGNYARFISALDKWKTAPGPSVLIILNKFDFFSGMPIPEADEYIIADRFASITSKKTIDRISSIGNALSGEPVIHVLSI